MNFYKQVSCTLKAINTKLFSIKKLFYLSFKVKLQFFKTFILPYFDYCLSLCIYYPKYVLQSLQNFNYFYIFKLFKFNFKNFDFKETNDFFRKFNIFSFEYRFFYRLSLFINKILYSNGAPSNLKKLLLKNENSYNL